jgi:hypothetical protein
MAVKPHPSLRFVHPPGTRQVVLTGRGGRLRGEISLANDGKKSVTVDTVLVEAELPQVRGAAQTAAIEAWTVRELAPGSVHRITVTAALDPLTPPGIYEGESVVAGVRQPVTLVVTEQIALSVSEPEVVVTPGDGEARRMVITNRGNVPLPVSRLGPVDLGVDRPRPTLLQRLGLKPYDDRDPRRDRCDDPPKRPTEEDRAREREDEPPATVTARIRDPIVVDPGETVATEWLVSVDGALRPGVRYRAVVPLYTTDIDFVVAPAQERAPAPPAPARRPRAQRKDSE